MKLLLILFMCVGLYSKTINIAASANLAFVMPQLVKNFNQSYPNIKVNFTISSSGKLYAQIRNGASYDIYMSANELYAQKLYNTNKSYSQPVVYAKGRLVFISVNKQFKSINLYHLPLVKKLAVGNPITVPYGVATKQALINAELYNQIKHKFVYGESISQTLSYAFNSTNYGIVALSALKAKRLQHLKIKTHYTHIDSKLYDPIKQAMIRLNNQKETKLFFDFLLSQKAKKIFKQYGY
ncbi:MAG: molybdate ABC transporter substrate-binding protein [Epsilonproteobacteria bacterium]|nr:MAG: molybdate ABC transporter substrate-binding protein [Campylobacterota bacterium]